MKTSTRSTRALLTGILLTGGLLIAGGQTFADVSSETEPVSVTVVRWPYT